MQQQVSHLHHLATGMGQPLPQVLPKANGHLKIIIHTCLFCLDTLN